MRKEFAHWIGEFGLRESRLVFVTGDLGYDAFENIQATFGARFLNVGVCEQNMIAVGAGLAQQGLMPVCYSIAPFAVFRPYEQIRLDVALHHLPLKIVGNGGGYGYGIMGATHHALEDLAVLSCLPGFACIVPLCGSDIAGACAALFDHDGPAYLRLGYGTWPESVGPLPVFEPVRYLARASRPKLTIVGIGPVLLNVQAFMKRIDAVDVFAVSCLPVPSLPASFLESVSTSQNLLVIEEHSRRGGLGEFLAAALAANGVAFRLHHKFAVGYPDGLYGSQSYHQQRSGLDSQSLSATVARLIS